jgi:hypothetical protein
MFVRQDPSEKVSERDKALRNSAIRSYIARAGHRKRVATVTVRHRVTPEHETVPADCHTTQDETVIEITDQSLHSSSNCTRSEANDGKESQLLELYRGIRNAGGDQTRNNPQTQTCYRYEDACLGPAARNDELVYWSTAWEHLMSRSNCYRGLRTDPFGFYSALSASTTDHFAHVVVPNQAPVWKIFNVTNIIPQEYLRLLQHEDYRFTVVASVHARKNLAEATLNTSPKLFRAQANGLVQLRKRLARLNEQVDTVVVITVCTLLILAWKTADMAAWAIHARHLSNIIEAAGSAELSDWVKSQIMQWEICFSYQPRFRLNVMPETYRRNPPQFLKFPLDSRTAMMLNKLPSGFASLAHNNNLSLQTIEVILRAVEASNNREYCTGIEQFSDVPRKYYDFWHACPCLPRYYDDQDIPSLEQLVVQALILYSFRNFADATWTSAVVLGMRGVLTRSVQKFVPRATSEEDALVWVWMNIVDAWRRESDYELTPEGEQLMKTLWTKHWFIHGEASVAFRLRLFFSNLDFERRCLDYMRISLDWTRLFES